MSSNVENMFSVRQIPWHKTGKILQNPPTSKEAIIEAGLDWEVALRDIYWSKTDTVGTIEYRQIPNRRSLVRLSDETPLALVSDHYKPLQNKNAFEWFDPIIQAGKATYETAGSLQNGKKIWILAKLSDDMDIVAGDSIRRYLLLANGHDGVTSILIQPTPIRVVCENTLNASLGAGMVQSVWHQGDVVKKMDKIKSLLGMAEESFTEKKEIFQKMAKVSVNNSTIGNYVTTLIPPAHKTATDKLKETIRLSQERIWELHENGLGADIPGVRGTVWGLYNAAIEYGQYDMARRVRDIGNYQLFGAGASFKQRAYDKALELI